MGLKRTDIGTSYASDADAAYAAVQARLQAPARGAIPVPAGVTQLFELATDAQITPQKRTTYSGLGVDMHYRLVADTYALMGVERDEVPVRIRTAQEVIGGKDTDPEHIKELSDFLAELARTSRARLGTQSSYAYFR